MSDNPDELSFSEMRKKRGARLPSRPTFEPALATYEFPPASNPQPSHSDPSPGNRRGARRSWLPFDPMRIVAALKAQRRTLIWSAAACAAMGMIAGWLLSEGKINVTLILRDVSTTFTAGAGEKYRPTPLAMQTLVELMNSQELARRVAAKAKPRISENALRDSATVTLGDEKDMVTLTLTGKSRRELATLAELYANEAVQLGRELQLAEVSRMRQFYQDRIAAAEAEMARINDELAAFQKETGTADPEVEAQAYTKQLSDLLTRSDSSRIEIEMLDMQIAALRKELGTQNPVAQKIEAAKSKLMDLLGRYTEMHPTVQAQREHIAVLERQLAEGKPDGISPSSLGEGSVGGALYMRLVEIQTRKATLEKELASLDSLKQSLQDKVTGVSRQSLRYAVIRAKLDSQKNSLSLLAGRQREAQLYEANAAGYFRLFATPTPADVSMGPRWAAMLKLGLAGVFGGIVLAGLAFSVREISDGRVRTTADVERITHLPVLATAGDLNALTPSQREQWAFRAWTALSGHLSASPNHSLV
ncbi:MAG TPA: hypothetical protein PKA41_15365, partial [Verrucomicrobiota bacterium]|nr:hypothetical protein [Verrucomicrobiota bacterium]